MNRFLRQSENKKNGFSPFQPNLSALSSYRSNVVHITVHLQHYIAMPRRSRRQPIRNPRGLGVNRPHQPSLEPIEKQDERSPRPSETRPRASLETRPRASSETRESSRTKESPRRRSKSVPRPEDMEIYRLQQTVKLLIPKLSFGRLIREVLQKYGGNDMHITASCLMAIQEAAEIYIVQFFEDADLCTHHRERETLMVKDMQLALALRRPC